MKKYTINEFENGLQELKKNDWYWNFDNDYKSKYKTLLNVDFERISKYSWDYVCDLMDFMLDANKRIFKGGESK